ncbi:MAG TPA: PA0069 family radical SAM protein [Arachidicoccus sp.]|nr:PA0069 family radical SAM protein [Arachidicoccus sp.]
MNHNDFIRPPDYQKGQGAQFNPHNSFLKQSYSKEEVAGIDDWETNNMPTRFINGDAKTIVNKVSSPDVGLQYSLNPYQGCEHGCIYCYARNSHEYWGFSAGVDFERNIIVKKNAPDLFRAFLNKKSWEVTPISISGNTDCYQPAERRYRLTRQLLEIALEYKQPVGMITKNSLALRDLDLFKELARLNLCCVYVSLNSLDEPLRQKLEPRTTTARQRLKLIESLSTAGVPVGVMVAPVIPGLNDTEIPLVLKTVASHGARWAGYTIVRLNGQVGVIFEDWLRKTFPDRADKVWHNIQACHAGQVNDSEFGRRMRGEGHLATLINHTFKLHCKVHSLNLDRMNLDCSIFARPGQGRQLNLFD